MKQISEEDLLHVYNSTSSIWESLRNKRILLTGGTGFFGKWILHSFQYINNKLELNAQLYVLSRDPERFLLEFSVFQNRADIHFIQGDIIDYDYNINVEFHYIIHAATAASDAINKNSPLLMLDTITVGTRKLLDFARRQPLAGFLYVSSGAIYGKQPADIHYIKESDSYKLDINNYASAYAEGKRIAELYCSIYHQKFDLPIKIARCFAFVGPYLPLDTHFAIGNFIRNVLANEDIVIKSDGSTVRSYMYASDLAAWLWTILINGELNSPYNVGSDREISILELAKLIQRVASSSSNIQVLGSKLKSNFVDRYVPNVDKAKQVLMLNKVVSLEDAISKTIDFSR
ncbi:NAD-dependent epimerase/dehydratase family protein [Arsenicibacter rosenii]|uniref:NAD-dependent epimerase/dehydratase domain-containing protein n=1 Tax=Arsenicibacter rosenii TaxID=1750698 RepID=A0A1S2VD83_9BACT|nr:NAD-dependent epimerase/dehydratase family protein [Arsenicibacter rosenii]OIN56370.1 hypothetical protein BLX24_25415 [Arsenicibacter rosenii]